MRYLQHDLPVATAEKVGRLAFIDGKDELIAKKTEATQVVAANAGGGEKAAGDRPEIAVSVREIRLAGQA